MRANVSCHLHIRLDGRDPADEAPESADDFREEYRAFWLRFEAWLRASGIAPVVWPSELRWWHVSFATPFRLDEVGRVLEWLHEQGVEVTNTHGNGSS